MKNIFIHCAALARVACSGKERLPREVALNHVTQSGNPRIGPEPEIQLEFLPASSQTQVDSSQANAYTQSDEELN